jgi:phage tail sheath protein FI
MTSYLHPGVYIKEVGAHPSVIEGVSTNVVGFIGKTEHIKKDDFDNGTLLDVPTRITSWTEYSEKYGNYDKEHSPYLALSVKGFFDNGGTVCYIVRVPDQASTADFIGDSGDSGDTKKGLAALENVDINIICMPGVTNVVVQQAMIKHCENLKYRFCILDSVESADIYSLKECRSHLDSSYGALYYPWLKVTGDSGDVVVMPPSGFIAGVFARMDAARGVHKPPANAGFNSSVDVLVDIDDTQQDVLNSLHINCLRFFPNRGVVIWGARTLSSDPEWKYLSVRRLFNFIEESIYKGTLWAVYEPNDKILWAAIKSTIETFLIQLWREGMLQGGKADEAFFVQCDRSVHTQDDIDNARVRINIGLAPLKPAEFIVIKMMQSTRG